MKIREIIFVVWLLANNVMAQTPYPIKEHYDKIFPTYNYSPTGIGSDHIDCYLTGNMLSWTLSSLLRMYETTKDKGYLIKFINLTIDIQNARKDQVYSGDDPIWVRKTDYFCDVIPGEEPKADDTDEPAYFNSLLIYPMAEFVNIVLKDPTFDNTNLRILQYIGQNDIDMSTLQV